MVNHKNIIKLYDIFEDQKNIYIVTEYVDGCELVDFLINNPKLKLGVIKSIFKQIVKGVGYCHNLKIVHRDLKLENILIDKNFQIKIIDFGLSNFIENKSQLLQTYCGSPSYTSPEILQRIEYDGTKSDVWSLGVILYALFVGKLPFNSENPRRLYEKIITCSYLMPIYLSKEASSLIRSCLDLQPEKRPDLTQIRNHCFFGDQKKNQKTRDTQTQYCVKTANTQIDPLVVLQISSLGFSHLEVLEQLESEKRDSEFMPAYLIYNDLSQKGNMTFNNLPQSKKNCSHINNSTYKSQATSKLKKRKNKKKNSKHLFKILNKKFAFRKNNSQIPKTQPKKEGNHKTEYNSNTKNSTKEEKTNYVQEFTESSKFELPSSSSESLSSVSTLVSMDSNSNVNYSDVQFRIQNKFNPIELNLQKKKKENTKEIENQKANKGKRKMEIVSDQYNTTTLKKKGKKVTRSNTFESNLTPKITRFRSYPLYHNENNSQWNRFGNHINPSLIWTKSERSLTKKLKKILKTKNAQIKKKSKHFYTISLDNNKKNRIDFEIKMEKVANLKKVTMLKFRRGLLDIENFEQFYQLISKSL
ncbi:kp78a-related [Anaeramoeba flamelloides]|uniref:Kp78a-related n=1 Tax=Anaeramoeba flamelloides TaxID=1746091 RepID=A0ABQ8Z031_9EUKA|nr:kp78a-related [Anaeramoeba flamelloides]